MTRAVGLRASATNLIKILAAQTGEARIVSAGLTISVPKGLGQKGSQLPRRQFQDADFEHQ